MVLLTHINFPVIGQQLPLKTFCGLRILFLFVWIFLPARCGLGLNFVFNLIRLLCVLLGCHFVYCGGCLTLVSQLFVL